MRRAAPAVAFAVAALTMAPPLAPGATRCPTPPEAAQRAGDRDGREVALTFDDGPGRLTPKVLDLLAREDTQATFFLVGRRVAGREALLRRMRRAGHEPANHSFTHARLRDGGAFARRELRDTSAAIRRATGATPCLFRPPFGATGPALRRESRPLRLTTVLWDVNPRDFTGPGADAIARRVLATVRGGSIVLLHDAGPHAAQTLEALPAILAGLRERGLRPVTASRLLRR